jgi:hydroxymethylbilane synthase
VRERFPGIAVLPVRGNVETRLAKLDRGEFDALMLATAGLKRLGLAHRIRTVVASELSLPAPGQGALAIECVDSRDDLRAWLAPLNDETTSACVIAERAVSRALGGSCQVPLAAHAVREGNAIWLRALVATQDGQQVVRADARAPRAEARVLGERVARLLQDHGADAVLRELAARSGT